MELTERIESINRQLIDLFGIDTITGRAIWRIVWSENQFEKRLIDTTPEGLFLLTSIVMEVPKYRQWIKEKYVLERLVIVPDINQNELPVSKLSYEPIFVFENARGEYLPPKMEVCKIVIDTVYAAQGKSSLAKYKDPDSDSKDPQVALAMQRARADAIMEELFSDETNISDALARKEGIIVPRNYDKNN
jgi:hypothetical protein